MTARSLDMVIAQRMWECDERRPCGWADLDKDEQDEWVLMAKAARIVLVGLMAAHAGQQEVRADLSVILEDLSVILADAGKRIARTTIAEYANCEES